MQFNKQSFMRDSIKSFGKIDVHDCSLKTQLKSIRENVFGGFPHVVKPACDGINVYMNIEFGRCVEK